MDKEGKLPKYTINALLKDGFYSGIGWSFGVTLGFVLISTVVVWILNILGGLPVVGSMIANVVEETQFQLESRIR